MKFEVNWPVSFSPAKDTEESTPHVGSGLDAMTGTLKQSALSPKDGPVPAVSHRPKPLLTWSVIQDDASASEYFMHTLDGSISTFVNWCSMEPHLKDIVFSHRAFTVILQYDSNVVTSSSNDFVVAERHKAKVQDNANFSATYGDHYISAMTRGSRRHILWTFEPAAGLESVFDLKHMTTEIFRNDVSLENGCNLLANLATRVPCTTLIWNKNQSNGVQPQAILRLLSVATAVPVMERLPILKVEIRPYDPRAIEGIPQINTPPYTPDIDIVRRLRDTMLQVALLRIFDRKSPLTGKEPYSDKLVPTDLDPIAKAFKSQNSDAILNLTNMLLLLARCAVPTWEQVRSLEYIVALPTWINRLILELDSSSAKNSKRSKARFRITRASLKKQ